MWSEVFKTVRLAMKSWGGVWRMSVCVAVLTVAFVVVLWASPHSSPVVPHTDSPTTEKIETHPT